MVRVLVQLAELPRPNAETQLALAVGAAPRPMAHDPAASALTVSTPDSRRREADASVMGTPFLPGHVRDDQN